MALSQDPHIYAKEVGYGEIDPKSMYRKYTNRGFVLNTKGFAGAIEMYKCKVKLNL
jgi:hypothetical protein